MDIIRKNRLKRARNRSSLARRAKKIQKDEPGMVIDKANIWSFNKYSGICPIRHLSFQTSCDIPKNV